MNNESFENLVGAQNTGSFTQTFMNITSLSEVFRYSDIFKVGGVPWQLAFRVENSARTGNKKYFAVYAHCGGEENSSLWSCKAEYELRVKTISGTTPNCAMLKVTKNFTRKVTSWGHPKFMLFEDLVKPANDYIEEDSITIELKIRMESVTGFHKHQLLDFESPNLQLFDGTITIRNCTLYVGKMYLSMWSSYFNGMFAANNDLTLNDVDPDEFLDVLHLIHPSDKRIDVKNVDHLLKLCKKFDIPMLMQKCADFLMSEESANYSLFKKLENAYTYKLPKLQVYCSESLKTVKDVVQLTKLGEYKNSGDGVKSMLFERMLELNPK